MKTNANKAFAARAGRHEFRKTRLDKYMVRAGKTDYAILLPARADGRVLFAADELAFFFREATGIALPRVADGARACGRCISLGDTSAGADVPFSVEEYGESGCRVATSGENYVLKGGYYGIVYAVYDLLSALFGWETFSARTIRIDRGVTELPLYDLDIADIPDFPYRARSHEYIENDQRLMSRFRMIDPKETLDGEDGPYHNNFNYLPPAVYRSAHPLWYSDDCSQMCYTAHGNAEERTLLVKEAANALVRFVRAHPRTPYIAFNHQDNFDWCACPACAALKVRYGGADSASAALFLNDVRAEMQKWFDGEGKEYDIGQKLVFFAYHGTNKPPVRCDEETGGFETIDEAVRLKNVIPWFAETNADYTCALTEGETNAPVAQNLRGWSFLSDEFLFWTYGTNFENYLAPYPSFEGTQNTYRFAKAQGAGMIFDECQINTAASTGWEELKGYLNYKLSWNTEEDAERLTREFFEASYGCAAKRMLAVYGQYRARAKKQIASGFCGWRSEFLDPVRKDWWDKAELAFWESEMTAAIAETAREESAELYARNVALERASVRYLLAEVFADEFAPEELLKIRRAAAEDLRRSNVTKFNEKKEISVLFEKWGV